MKHIIHTMAVCAALLFPFYLNASPIHLRWEVGYANKATTNPVQFIPATVPGAVQLDIAKAENYPSYLVDDHYKRFSWMEDMYYTYRTRFSKPDLEQNQRLFFFSKGIDYQFEIRLNDSLIKQQEGMFTYVDLDITDLLKEQNELTVLVFPAPKRHPSPVDRTQASNVTKPAVSYEWDWHPRLIPLGIWDDTGLEIRSHSYINDLYINYTLSDNLQSAQIQLVAETTQTDGCSYRWSLIDMTGKEVLTRQGKMKEDISSFPIQFEQPKLWWPHDHGTPYLYTSRFELTNSNGSTLQTLTQKIGFRTVKLVRNVGGPGGGGFPASVGPPPAQVEINGRRIFAKGSNWVNPEIFPGIITRDRYAELIDLGVKANFNLFRVWGGGIINKTSFFELCDEKGIMVWEEFPLACNVYPDDPHYLKILRQEAISIVKRLRKHPCIAMWCGGNELFWTSMTEQSLPLRLLNSVCYELHPQVPYNPTSPLVGMAHGNYIFRYQDGREVYEAMNNARNTAYTEFGMPGLSPIEVIKQIIPQKDWFPPKEESAWKDHHAFKAWEGNTWLCPEILEHYFGKASTLEELIEKSQWLQCEGYKAIFEEARRQKPYCAMALNWCYNEPWPSAANNSLIVYPAIPKPAFYAVSNACRPVCASARIHRFVWKADDEFYTDLYLLNDKYEELPQMNVSVVLEADNQRLVIATWKTPEGRPNTNIVGPTIRYRLPKWNSDRMTVRLEVENHPELNSEYTLRYNK